MFVFFSLLTQGQNLVQNYSFENITSCNFTNAGINNGFCPPWVSATLGGSPDLYNQCCTNAFTTPFNVYGFQYAKTGVGYVGIASFTNYREYIEGMLLDSLVAGKKYCVEFFISQADSFRYAIDGFGAYLSNTIVNINTSYFIALIPQISNLTGNIIKDTANWIKISGNFIAQGGEKYITIGNFKDDANTNIDSINAGYYGSYYFIDDVSVYECDSTSNIFMPNVFTPNGDGQNDVFYVSNSGLQDLHYSIYDRWGIKVFEASRPNERWDGRTTSGVECKPGVYYVIVSANGLDGKEYNERGFVHLIR